MTKKKANKAYYLKNKDKVSAKMKEYYQKNKEIIKKELKSGTGKIEIKMVFLKKLKKGLKRVTEKTQKVKENGT